ncbi:MAG TPA: carboxypeptidase regulatory-like domain-containing protein [Vicinamibacterales bacterium]|nr:carboxypeptidase regulatory-like domain-containing protein [Vicinamibacterales bacterium]
MSCFYLKAAGRSFLLLWLLWAVSLAQQVDAQSHRAAIRGRVEDPSGAVIAGAAITATNEATHEVRAVVTGENGAFAIVELPPGVWTVEIAVPGHKTHVQRLTLEVDQERHADVRLELGEVTDRVEVTAPPADLRRGSSAQGTVVDNRQILDMPLDGRNFLELTLLVPGALPAAQGSAGSVRGDFSFSVNGGREDANDFLLDGADNVDPKLNTIGVKPPVDAIQEFEVLTSTPEAGSGVHSAGLVNVVLKSGTNEVRGTTYGFFRNGALDARNHFAPSSEPAPEYQRNQAGFSLGGPIARDRSFFFADYEETRANEGITRIATVPTAAELASVPDFLSHPVGRAIAALYPAPNRPGAVGNFVSSPTQRDRVDLFDIRGDVAAGRRLAVMSRYSFADRRFFEPFSGAGFSALPGYGSNVDRRGQNLIVNATQIWSSQLLNETRVGFNRVSAGVQPELNGSTNRGVGLPELWTNPRDAGLSFITVSGFSPIGQEYNNPQHGTTNTLQVGDTLTWTRGSHLIRSGFDSRFIRQDAFRDVLSRGTLAFTGAFTGSPLADLLMGLPTFTTLARLDNPQRLRTKYYAAFMQDSVRLRQDLTLSAGLRYDVNSPPVDAGDRATLYDPVSHSLLPVGTGGLPRAGYKADRNNWGPRVGIAWTADSSAQTVVRSAYGIRYNLSALAPSEGLYFNAPYFNYTAYFTSPAGLLTLSDPFPRAFPIPTPNSALGIQRDLRTPYAHEFNLNVQRQLGATRLVEIGYVGSRGRDLIAARDINQPQPSAVQPNLRPDPRFADITFIESRARSRYDSLQASFQQRYEFGCTMLVAYTLGKSMDDASGFFASAGDPNFPQDSHNPGAEWGRSNFDVRHRFSVSFSYAIPFGRGRGGTAEALLGDWTVSGIVAMQSGPPFTVALLPEVDNSNTGQSSLGFGANDRPNLVGNPKLNAPTAARWFDTAAFTLPPYGSFGSAGRNILEGPGYQNVNLALLKQVPISSRVGLQVRIEAFNLLNRVNLDLPDNFFGSPTFGQVLSAGSPRHVQFGARLSF